jgi:hypothetical protein
MTPSKNFKITVKERGSHYSIQNQQLQDIPVPIITNVHN